MTAIAIARCAEPLFLAPPAPLERGSGGVEDWQSDDKLAPAAQAFAQCLHAAAVHFHQATHEGQAQPKASLRMVERVINLCEEVEYSRQHFRRDADPVIPDTEDDRQIPRSRRTDGLVRLGGYTSRRCSAG